MPDIRESDLPGIGRKFQIITRSGDKLTIIVHDDGRREIYHADPDDPDNWISMVTLDDTEARQVAGIIGGLAYRPQAIESVEVALNKLIIEWYKVEPHSKCVGRTIGELQIRQKTGATVIAIIEKDETQVVNPGPDCVIKPDSTLVVMGERQHIKAFRQLISTGSE
ncbi:MAG: potassium:proton antiporter [Bacillota bacterium]|nr:MAG: potassium:proton antiporter [Bacillota bacterium]